MHILDGVSSNNLYNIVEGENWYLDLHLTKQTILDHRSVHTEMMLRSSTCQLEVCNLWVKSHKKFIEVIIQSVLGFAILGNALNIGIEEIANAFKLIAYLFILDTK